MKFSLPQLSWKTWLTLGFAASTGLLALAVLSQWRYATLGKQVSRNVTKFLTDHGARVENGVVSGGIMTVPLKLNTAINSTILQMLEAVAAQMVVQGAPEEKEEEVSFETPARSSRGRAPPEAEPRRSSAPPSTEMGSPSPRMVGGLRSSAPAPVTASPGSPHDDSGFTDPRRGKDCSGYDPSDVTPMKRAQVSLEEMLKD